MIQPFSGDGVHLFRQLFLHQFLYKLKIFFVVDEVEAVAFDDKQRPKFIAVDPRFLMPVELFQIFPLDALFVRPSPFQNLLFQRVDGGAEVNHQIRRT